MDKVMTGENFDSVFGFDDEVDCAILNDERFESALVDVNEAVPTTIDTEDDIDEDLIDPNVDYSNEDHSPDIVDMDADDYIAAEREIINDPFEEDDLIDAAVGDDDYIDDDIED